MFVDILIALSAGLFIHFGTRVVNFYFNFYHIFKYLDSYQKLNYFKSNNLVLTLIKFTKVKNIIINYILIPIIKINYVIISIFTSILYTLCEDDFKLFLNKKGIDTNDIKILLKTDDVEVSNEEASNCVKKSFESHLSIENQKNNVEENEIKESEEVNNQLQNGLLINHNFIHKINTNYDKEISDVIELENSLRSKTSKVNSSNQNNLSSPGSSTSTDSFGTNALVESKSNMSNISNTSNLNLMNEIEIINRKNLKQQNEIGDELLDNYIVSESSQIKKKELERSLNEFKNNINNSSIKILSEFNDKKIPTSPEIKEQIETIQIDEIDFGINVNDMVEKYSREGKIKIVDFSEPKSQDTKINETKVNEIKIGKKKR